MCKHETKVYTIRDSTSHGFYFRQRHHDSVLKNSIEESGAADVNNTKLWFESLLLNLERKGITTQMKINFSFKVEVTQNGLDRGNANYIMTMPNYNLCSFLIY